MTFVRLTNISTDMILTPRYTTILAADSKILLYGCQWGPLQVKNWQQLR